MFWPFTMFSKAKQQPYTNSLSPERLKLFLGDGLPSAKSDHDLRGMIYPKTTDVLSVVKEHEAAIAEPDPDPKVAAPKIVESMAVGEWVPKIVDPSTITQKDSIIMFDDDVN